MTCPSRHEIKDCLAGRLSVDDLESIYFHAEDCASCTQVFAELESEMRSAASPLQRLSGAAEPIEPACRQMMSSAATLLSNNAVDGGYQPATTPEVNVAPKVIRDYELHEVIGMGGMGTVYRAWHTRLKRSVAIKVLSATRSGSRRADRS